MTHTPDMFTKIILSVIALCLVFIALHLIFETEQTQAAQKARFSPKNFQIAYTNGGFLVFDATTGDIWMYNYSGKDPDFIGRLKELGKTLQKK
ncbi:hypothetical protein CSA56_00905 [candidate division KSB3 bacterium]|uniref:Uncharacterized protein n=1 Tax=candidate division KSB3 bacterium TaxID=2044937 RepID=A0A2G6KKL9_9BACT|nr:MAG: hypothetical protein CSA56_00905 [candidate division KSB3 bacterium]